MSSLQDMLDKEPPAVAEAIEQLIERAGTSDADWAVLKAAGSMLTEACETLQRANKRADGISEIDWVNDPPHYKTTRKGDGRYNEAIDLIEDFHFGPGFWLGNACKYIIRWEAKGAVQDLKKARWYIKRAKHHKAVVAYYCHTFPVNKMLSVMELQREFPQLPQKLSKALRYIISVMEPDRTEWDIGECLHCALVSIDSFVLGHLHKEPADVKIDRAEG